MESGSGWPGQRWHSTVALTLDTYSHVIPAIEEEAADRIAALIFHPT